MNSAEFGVLKMSGLSSLRDLHFDTYANECKNNAPRVLELARLRKDLAIAARQKDYFTMRMKQMTFKVASDSKDFLAKIDKIREVVQPLALRDIDTLKKLTGLNDISYQDIVFLKRAIREVILSRDPNNIQMLKCFTLENSLQGLCLLLKKVLAPAGTNPEEAFIVTTTVLDKETGELLNELDGVFDFSFLNTPDTIVLFQLQLRDRGTIILDLFERETSGN